VGLVAFGSGPEFDEDPAFARWLALWPQEYRMARGAVRREWKKLRPNQQTIAQMMEVLPRQLASERWVAQFWPPNPAAYLRDERMWDWVEPERRVGERRQCEHEPPCPNPSWHLVMLDRDKQP
jgi:hypothetical protein